MSEQAVDLRSTWTTVRRRPWPIVAAALVGGLIGAGLLVLNPPPYSSTSVVLLPAVTQAGSGKTGAYDADTQVLIATSSEVLGRAALEMDPELSQSEIIDRVTVEAPASAVVRITATGPTSTQAEDLAFAVAGSLVAYLGDSARTVSDAQKKTLQARLDTLDTSLESVNAEIAKAQSRLDRGSRASSAGRADAAALSELTAVRASTVLDIDAVKKQLDGDDVTGGQVVAGASVIQPASPGEQPALVVAFLGYVVGCAVLLTLLALLYLVATNQRDPKLRSRDEVADAVGIPVLASLRSRAPRSATGWTDLLRGYAPDSADGWGLRQLIHTVVPDSASGTPSGEPFVLVVLSLSGDSGGLAFGPQIAAFAASHEIETQLWAVQQHEAAAPLWAACTRTGGDEAIRPFLTVTTVPDPDLWASLSVRMVVLDRESPRPEEDAALADAGAVLLAVGSATATRRNLADAVVAADRTGLAVSGLIVTNPDPLDRTSGRLSPRESTTVPAKLPTTIVSRAPKPPAASAGGQRRRSGKGKKR